MTSVKHLLLETLNNLGSKKLKTFKWYLKDDGLASVADVEKAESTTDTVDLVVARRGLEGAVKITLDILRKMKEYDLAEQLQKQLQANNVITPTTGQTINVSAQGLNAQPQNFQPRVSVIAFTGEEDSEKRSDGSLQGKNKGMTGRAGVRPRQHQQKETKRGTILHLFQRLHLDVRHKLRAADVLQINKHSLLFHESCAEEHLIQTYLQKLVMMDYRARNIKTNQTINAVHSMDVQMAVFHCADGLLKQLMVTKLSQCQFALPLLVPDPFTRQIEFPLWTFRQITKTWKMRNINNEFITQPIYRPQTPMVFFFRFGSVSSSKSQLMNSLINEKHNTFFHRHCHGSSRTRVLMEGVVEIAWFCPSGRNDDKFTDCVAFCNLHGDARDHEKQLRILTDMSSVNVVLFPRLKKNDKNMIKLKDYHVGLKPLICLYTKDVLALTETQTGQFKIGLKNRNQSDVSEELRVAINACLSGSSHTFRLEDVSKHSEIRVDEEEDGDCRRGRAAAQKMMSLLKNEDLTEIKESFLPHQGKLWHQWSQKNKELHRPRGDEIEIHNCTKQTEIKKIREQQHESDISEFINLFIKEMNSGYEMFFLQWLRVLLDEHTSAHLYDLQHKYHEKWSALSKLRQASRYKCNINKNIFCAEQAELERVSEALQAVNFGLEHIMREIGQIYESCSSVKKNKKDLPVDFSSLPSLAAEMMISGSPLELMDGDAAHVPRIWISAVLDQLIQKLGDQRVFVLSVLGLRGSGKSTLINAMFGLQFAVSAGRCTRGALMQLLRVSDEMRTQMNTNYILIVDTEGLRALELSGRSTRDHDNELATFVVGLGNLTLINIFRENPAEMQDILQIVVQAFMRMKKVKLNPRCVFVHQNVSDVTAGEKNMEGRRRLLETLDEMTRLAAKEEVCDAERFSDIIKFDVQKDVKYFAHLWEGSPPMAPPNPNYCENIQDLKETIITYASKSDGMRLIEIKDCIKDLCEDLLNEGFIFYFKKSQEISAYKLETKYSKLSWSFSSAMMQTENKLRNKIENDVIREVDCQRELKNTSEGVEKSLSESFEKDKCVPFKFEASQNEIKELPEKNSVREKRKRRLNEVLQQQENMKKKIDTQRKHHENTLYEKSKELALKLRGKANEEETMKKEFALFWDQCVKKIIRDTPALRDIDIMRDAREILSDIYEGSLPTSHIKEDSEFIDIFTDSSFFDYVIFKNDIKKGVKDTLKDAYGSMKGTFEFASLSPEDEAQLRSFITDVDELTHRMIQSFNISETGYNISYIQQLTDYIRAKVTEHGEISVKYVFKNEFFMDLVLSICKRANRMITEQHRLFREDNDPVIYVEKKREEYYSIFQKYCHRSTSAVIFGEIICQKLKEPIKQSVFENTSRQLAGDMRSNLEKYTDNPTDYSEGLITDEVNRYITDHFSVGVLPKIEVNIKLLQQKIMEAAHKSTEHVQENRGDAYFWLKSFTQELSDKLIFSEKDLSGVKVDDVDDFNLLHDVIRQELPYIISDIMWRFNRHFQ